MRRLFLTSMIAITGCALSTPKEAENSSAETSQQCVPFVSEIRYSCWISSPDAPLTHCVALPDQEDKCGLRVKGGAFLTRGAKVTGDLERHPNGSWGIVSVKQDEQGRVGFAGSSPDGPLMRTHDQSAVPTGQPIQPRWPRWPASIEFGPEQAK